MVLFKLRLWLLFGPNLLAAGLYPLRDRHTIFFWFRERHAFTVRLPIAAREGW